MAVTRQVDAQMVGQMFAEMVRDDPNVHGIYVRPIEDSIEVWMLTSHADYEAESCLYESAVTLQRRYPDTYIQLFLANPRHYPPEYDLMRDVIPGKAVAVSMVP